MIRDLILTVDSSTGKYKRRRLEGHLETHQQILSIPRKIDSQREGDRFQRESCRVEEEGGLAAVRELRRSDAGTLRGSTEGDAD